VLGVVKMPIDRDNPDAAPRTDITETEAGLVGASGEADTIRKSYFQYEGWIMSLGTIHYLGASMGLMFALRAADDRIRGPRGGHGSGFLVIAIVYLALPVVIAALGYGLRCLQNWARWIEVALLLIGTCATIVRMVALLWWGLVRFAAPHLLLVGLECSVILMLASPIAGVIFSRPYRDLIEKTPHMRHALPWVVKLFIGLIISLVTLVALLALSTPRPHR
jgi:hypothetical protein